MSVPLSVTESAVITSLRSVLLAVLGVPVIQAQGNRVPPPAGPDYVTITPLMRNRLSTNVDSYTEATMIASITADLMTVTALLDGHAEPGMALAGDNVQPFSILGAIIDGTPGAEVWRVSPSQTVPSGLIYAGAKQLQAGTLLTLQLDVHGPRSADLAQIISTVLRDDYACQAMAADGLGAQPCYTSDPRQMVFWTGEMQAENRWMVDAVLQINPVVSVPQQFAGVATIGLVEVDSTYPPGET